MSEDNVTLETLKSEGIVSEDGTNAKSLTCRICNEEILSPGLGTIVNEKVITTTLPTNHN